MTTRTGLEIAVIGLAGRFPDAPDVSEYWRNLSAGRECITRLTDEQLKAANIAQEVIDNPSYVPAVGIMADEDQFDARFFDFNPREAEIIDPQQRVFLEAAWTALEDAGYTPRSAVIGVYAGTGANYYSINNLMSRPDYLQLVDPFQMKIGMDVDFLATRVCYKLNLQGPGLTVQTACSTSLVAIHVACQGLLSGACDIALAGGVAVRVPQRVGAMHKEGGIVSPDGHCRAFDASAQGTVGGNGVGVVVLKRLQEALDDGDHIYAVVRGSAINNDGSRKVGFTAPSVEGQARAIRAAQLMADVEPDSISYIETHGTGTALGDPIEIAALTKAFREGTERKQYCWIGSAKSAIGHLDTAAGVAGFVKAVLALHHEAIPPSLHFERPNPAIDFANSPFQVNAELRPWPKNPANPRRAGVSSFGIGGTNAHVVLEEAPPVEAGDAGRRLQLVCLSARSEAALGQAANNLARHLEAHPELPLADVAFTSHVGREPFGHRLALLASDSADAAAALATRDASRVLSARLEIAERQVVFLFPGQGAQYPGMGRELYEGEAVFRERLDRCAEILTPHLGFDLRELIYPAAGEEAAAAERLMRTENTQPALFAVEYALAGLWQSWGLEPQAMIGHSIGEYVAACLAGVFSLEDALALVAARGRLMTTVPAGAMLSVPRAAEDVRGWLGPDVWLSAVNAPNLTVLGGTPAAIDELTAQLRQQGIDSTRLHTSHAFHTAMMDPILDAFRAEVAKVERRAPKIPFVSNLTGTWITAEQAMDPAYWADHLRQPVRFAEGAMELLSRRERAFVEVGPGKTLATFLRQTAGSGSNVTVQPSLRHPKDTVSDLELALTSLAKLWLDGVPVDWRGFYRGQRRRRVALPTYPFERRRFWVEAGKGGAAQPLSFSGGAGGGEAAPTAASGRHQDPAKFFYRTTWQRTAAAPALAFPEAPGTWMVVGSELPLGVTLSERLEAAGQTVVRVAAGEGFAAEGEGSYRLKPGDRASAVALFEALGATRPDHILYLWALGGDAATLENRAFLDVLALVQAAGAKLPKATLTLVADQLASVTGGEAPVPEKALLEGPYRVIPQEFPGFVTRLVDVGTTPVERRALARATEQVLAEALSPVTSAAESEVVAYRGSQRWLRHYEPAPLDAVTDENLPLRKEGVYILTGGLGGVGLATAEELAASAQARMVLVGRSLFPARANWPEWLASHPEHDPVSRQIRRIEAIERRGGQVIVASADVASRDEMREVFALAETRFGAVHGVFHLAGVPVGGLIQHKDEAEVRRGFAPKLDGTRVLADLCAGRDIDLFVIASSLAAALGGVGQVEYVAANAYLDAFALAEAARGGLPAVSFNWDSWSESGMAVAGSGGALLQRGVAHPLLDRCEHATAERFVYATDFTADSHWVIAEHAIEGVHLLPGTAFLELAAGAFREATQPAGGVQLAEVSFLNPLLAPEKGEREARVFLTRTPDGGYRFSIATDHGEGAGRNRFTEYSRGTVTALAADAPTPERRVLQEIIDRIGGEEIQFDPTQIRHGRHWQVARWARRNEAEMLAAFELPADLTEEAGTFTFHPSLMDAATSFFAAGLSIGYLPVAYDELRSYRALPASIYSHVLGRPGQQEGDDTLKFDITVFDAAGEVIAEVVGFTLRRVDDTGVRLEDVRKAQDSQGSKSAKAAANAGPVADGLTDHEGREVLRRALGHLGRGGEAQVLVSTVDLAPRLARYRSTTIAELVAQSDLAMPMERHPRPEISTEYLAPRSDVEKAVAVVWEELLGLEQVGVHDDFFELGGHSLLGIQINSRLRDLYKVELAAGTIFERPTVAQLAAAVVEGQTVGNKGILAELAVIEQESQEAAASEVDQMSEDELDAMLAALLEDEQGQQG